MISLGLGVDVSRQHPTSAEPRYSVQAAHESAPKKGTMEKCKMRTYKIWYTGTGGYLLR